MSPDEWKLYDRVCNSRFANLEAKMDNLKGLFIGGLTGIVGVLVVVIADFVVHL